MEKSEFARIFLCERIAKQEWMHKTLCAHQTEEGFLPGKGCAALGADVVQVEQLLRGGLVEGTASADAGGDAGNLLLHDVEGGAAGENIPPGEVAQVL